MKTTILIVGHALDVQTQHQARTLAATGARVLLLPASADDGDLARLEWTGRGVSIAGVDLANVDAALVRGLPPSHPMEPAFLAAADQRLSWPDWFQESCRQRDRSDTLLGFLLALEASGTPMMNAPSRSLISRRKPFQLDLLRRLGCPVPETLVTNDPDAARAFVAEVGDAIVKPASGGALTLSANALDAVDLERVRSAPAIFQRRIQGDDLRVMVLDGEVISSVAIGVPEGTLDFRGDQTYQAGRITYAEAALPRRIRRLAGEAAQALGLRFGGLDLKRTPHGEYVFLECNSSPIYLDVERKLGHPITQRICARLLDDARRSRSITTRRFQRPAAATAA